MGDEINIREKIENALGEISRTRKTVNEVLIEKEKLSESEVIFVLQQLIGDDGQMTAEKKQQLKQEIKRKHETTEWLTKEITDETALRILKAKGIKIIDDDSIPQEKRRFQNLKGNVEFDEKEQH